MTEAVDPQQPPRQFPPVQPRIGDAERDQAVAALQVHMTEGRLDHEEFDERLSRALVARTAADLQPLFDDLPEPRPAILLTGPAPRPPSWSQTATVGSAPAVVPRAGLPASRPTPPAARLVLTLIWPIAVLLCFVSGWDNWWWLIIAGIISAGVKQAYPGAGPDAEKQRAADK